MSMTCLLFPVGTSWRTAYSFAGWFDRISALAIGLRSQTSKNVNDYMCVFVCIYIDI